MAEIYVALNLYSLKIGAYDLEFSSIFKKNFKKHITEINVYGMYSFSITLIDPLSLSRLTVVKLKNVSSLNSIFILNPSIVSSHRDIQNVVEKLLNNYQKEEKELNSK